MGPVLQSAFLRALGWSLIDSLWQLGLIWLLYLVLTVNGKKFNANVRHNLALLSLGTGSIWFIITIVLNLFTNGSHRGDRFFRFLANAPGSFDLVLPWLSIIYLSAAGFMMIRFYKQLSYTKRLSVSGLTKAHPEIRVFLQELAGRMGIHKPISVWLSDLVETPLTIGFWKPVILLPVSIVNNLSMRQTEAIILHELYHIQRNDFVMNFLIATSDVILFFNPFARFFKDIIQREREHRCDDIVIQFRYEPGLYAQALLLLEKQRPVSKSRTTGSISVAATGNHKMLLLARVKRILTGETLRTPISHRLACFFLIAMGLGTLGYQTQLQPVGMAVAEVKAIMDLPVINNDFAQVFNTAPTIFGPVLKPDRTATKPIPDKKTKGEKEVIDLNLEKDFAEVIITGKLEQLISGVANQPVPEFVASEQPREYTISIDQSPVAPAETEPAIYPFVPSSSFQYKPSNDTALPKKNGVQELTTSLQLARSFEAIDAINWSKIEKNLEESGEKINVNRLKTELKNAIAGIDWRDVNADLENAGKASAAEVEKYREQLAAKYQQYERAKLKHIEHVRAAEQAIINERLSLSRQGQRPKTARVKKIVTI
jgi:bla regulator protein blaR1